MQSGQFEGVDFRSGVSFSISCLVHPLERVKVVSVEKCKFSNRSGDFNFYPMAFILGQTIVMIILYRMVP